MEPMGNLGGLENLFSNEEIDRIIHDLPTEKTPGPDGLNSDFMKKMLERYRV
jgi:hypothetical protein